MLLSWFGVFFWLQGASIWFAALRVLGMRQRAMPGLVTEGSAVLDAQTREPAGLFHFTAWTTRTGMPVVFRCPVIHQQWSFEWKEDLAAEMVLAEGEGV